jgi:peptidoglycan/LPS O-acetylase OafA/YrhL
MARSAPALRAQAPRAPGLDLLRAAAILWVMLYHLAVLDMIKADAWIVRFGWMGVDLFFVLSGYLIAGQLFRPYASGGRPDFRRFFMRRLMRTLPAFWVVLAIYLLVPVLDERRHIQPAWQFLSFTQNLLLPTRPVSFSHAWSLCVEEQFYLALPLVLMLLALRPGAKATIGVMAVVLLGGMALRGWLWGHDGDQYMRFIYYPTYSRLDGLLAGVAAAAVQVFRPELWKKLTTRPNLLLVLGFAGVLIASLIFGGQVGGFWAAVLGYPLIALSLGLVVVAGSVPNSLIGKRALPGAAAIAAVSYSLYLSHKLVFHAVSAGLIPLPDAWKPLAPVIAVVLAAPVGAALYLAVERPFLKLRDRLEGPSRSSLAREPAIVLAPAEP